MPADFDQSLDLDIVHGQAAVTNEVTGVRLDDPQSTAMRVKPRVYDADGSAATLWTCYPMAAPDQISATEYADALQRLHAAMRRVEIDTPHFMDRASEAERLVADRDQSPGLDEANRQLLLNTLHDTRRQDRVSPAAEQVLHGHAIRATSSAPSTECSSISKRVAAAPSSSTFRTRQRMSASTTRASTKTCSTSAGGWL